jgi:hypothetical protein
VYGSTAAGIAYGCSNQLAGGPGEWLPAKTGGAGQSDVAFARGRRSPDRKTRVPDSGERIQRLGIGNWRQTPHIGEPLWVTGRSAIRGEFPSDIGERFAAAARSSPCQCRGIILASCWRAAAVKKEMPAPKAPVHWSGPATFNFRPWLEPNPLAKRSS